MHLKFGRVGLSASDPESFNHRQQTHRSQRHRWLVAFTLAAASAGVSHAEPVQFFGLGDLPGGAFSSTFLGMSRDGRTIVGHSLTEGTTIDRQQAFRWSRDTGMQGLPFPPGTRSGDGRAVGVTDDSLEVLGTAERPVKWVTGVPDPILLPLPDGWFVDTSAISADGQVSVGKGGPLGPDTSRPLRWNPDSMPLVMEGTGSAFVRDLAPDGSFTIGTDKFGFRDKAVIWDAEGRQSLLPEPDPLSFSTAIKFSTDGEFIVGSVGSMGAVIWDLAGGYEIIPASGGFMSPLARAASDGAEIVVGAVSGTTGRFAAFWDENRQVHLLQEYLSNRGIDMTGWHLSWTLAVSSDGRVLAGQGTNPDGNQEAWVAYIPGPGAAGLFLVGFPILTPRRRRQG